MLKIINIFLDAWPITASSLVMWLDVTGMTGPLISPDLALDRFLG